MPTVKDVIHLPVYAMSEHPKEQDPLFVVNQDGVVYSCLWDEDDQMFFVDEPGMFDGDPITDIERIEDWLYWFYQKDLVKNAD